MIVSLSIFSLLFLLFIIINKLRLLFITFDNNLDEYINNHLANTNDTMIINLIIMKYPSSTNNFRISKNLPNIIKITYYNYSLLFSSTMITEFSYPNDIYYIYHYNSSNISYNRISNDTIINEITNPSVLYKINTYNDLYEFIENYNDKKSRFIYIEIILYDITINKLLKSYKTRKTSFYIKRNILDTNNTFLKLFKSLNENNGNFYYDISNKNAKLTLRNDNGCFEITNFYNDADYNYDKYNNNSIIDVPLEYTHRIVNEYNDYYY